MRAILFLLAIVVLVAIALVATGVIDIRQTREGRLPEGAQAPAFDVDLNPVEVGTERREVEVPVPVVRQREERTVETETETVVRNEQ